MKKILKYSIWIIVLAFLVYNSVYFKKLDAVKASNTKFDPISYANNYFYNKLTPALDSAIEINQLIALLKTDKENTFNKYSHALGIGNIRYFLVKGKDEVKSLNENDVTVGNIRIATEFVFGNAIRDASGKIDVNEFKNTMDFNNVSSQINKIVREKVLPPFKSDVKK
jgi:predicted lipoprotein